MRLSTCIIILTGNWEIVCQPVGDCPAHKCAFESLLQRFALMVCFDWLCSFAGCLPLPPTSWFCGWTSYQLSSFFSNLLYCSSVWSNATQAYLDKLQAVQNFACRILCSVKKFDHITPLLKDLHWLPIRQQLYFCLAVLVFKTMTYEMCSGVLSEDPPSRQGIPETVNFWRYHSSVLLAAKGPFNIEQPQT